MIPRSKRVLYSAVSTAISVAICDVGICVRSELVEIAQSHTPSAVGSPIWLARLVGGLFAVLPWVLLLCIPGWILALPVTLFASVRSGLRFWMWWVIGTCIGPAVMYAISWHFVHSYAQGQSRVVWNSWFSLATGVAGCATLLYLWLLRREQQKMRTEPPALGEFR